MAVDIIITANKSLVPHSSNGSFIHTRKSEFGRLPTMLRLLPNLHRNQWIALERQLKRIKVVEPKEHSPCTVILAVHLFLLCVLTSLSQRYGAQHHSPRRACACVLQQT